MEALVGTVRNHTYTTCSLKYFHKYGDLRAAIVEDAYVGKKLLSSFDGFHLSHLIIVSPLEQHRELANAPVSSGLVADLAENGAEPVLQSAASPCSAVLHRSSR